MIPSKSYEIFNRFTQTRPGFRQKRRNENGSLTHLQRLKTAIYQWLAAEDPLTWEKPGPRGPRLLDYQALEKHVAAFPDKTLAERAEHFGVSKDGIWYALSKLRITRKKKFRV